MLSSHKLKKKKQRERLVKEKIARKRAGKAKVDKDVKLTNENIKKLEKEFNERRKVVKNMSVEEKEAHDKTVKEKLAYNLEMLKALEEEYDKEKTTRDLLNKKLEDDGNTTAAEKIEAIKKVSQDLINAQNKEKIQ